MPPAVCELEVQELSFGFVPILCFFLPIYYLVHIYFSSAMFVSSFVLVSVFSDPLHYFCLVMLLTCFSPPLSPLISSLLFMLVFQAVKLLQRICKVVSLISVNSEFAICHVVPHGNVNGRRIQ